MDYWYLGAGGNQMRMFQDIWGYWTTADGEPVEVDASGQVTDEDGNWLGSLYGDAKEFAEDTRDQLLEIPKSGVDKLAMFTPIALTLGGLVVIWYFSPWLKR